MSINWFPGHMTKARREIAESMARTDVVVEVLDARLPRASRNSLLQELRGDKPCITVLNRDDLADPVKTELWKRWFDEELSTRVIALSAKDRSQAKRVTALCRRLLPERGTLDKPVRAMVIGIPNVGKSTLINTLKGRSVADVGNKPAVTKRRQTVQITKGITIADTPGVLWPKIEKEIDGYRLAASGAISDRAIDSMQVAEFVARFLVESYPGQLRERYRLDVLPEHSRELIETIGRRRGCLVRGGEVDFDKASNVLLHDLRIGKLGRISFEEPD